MHFCMEYIELDGPTWRYWLFLDIVEPLEGFHISLLGAPSLMIPYLTFV
jgi:hypothetical protein